MSYSKKSEMKPMSNENEFLNRYGSHLNEQQLEAVTSVEGPVLLLAVPGSGKTTVLVTRLGYMMQCCHIAPENILVLTYTVAATADMRERYLRIFGEQRRLPEFRTINGICAKIIQEYGRRIGKPPFELLTEDKIINRFLTEIYRKITGEYATESDIKGLRTWIAYIKNMMLTEQEIQQLNEELDLPISAILKEYNAELKRNSYMDYDDQMQYAYIMLKKTPELLKEYQDIYQYICVDEAQDTSKIQHEIIRLLAGTNGNLFMVGDEDQSIYGFRAAYPEALLEFEQNHEGAKVLLMEQNYRSDARIVEVANQFIQKNQLRHKKVMNPTRISQKDVEYISLRGRAGQYRHLITVAKNCTENTAVLYRDNESAIPLIDLLDREGIPFRLKNSDMAFFTNRIVLDVLNILKFGYDQKNEEIFMQIYYKIQTFLKKEQAIRICKIARQRDINILQAVEYEDSISGMVMGKCRAIRTHYLNMRDESPYKALNRIVKFMGYAEYLERNKLQDHKIDILELLAGKEDSIPGFLERLTHLQELISTKENSYEDCFILSTIHSSKGLEYDRVYLLDVCDGVFPDQVVKQYKGTDPDTIRHYEEERRLFYVGMTRAKNQLYIFSMDQAKSSFVEEVKKYSSPKSRTESSEAAVVKNTGRVSRSSSVAGGQGSAYGKSGSLTGRQGSTSEYRSSFVSSHELAMNHPVELPEIHIGDQIIQQVYGEGIIVGISEGEDGTPDIIEVEYDTWGIKKYKYAAAFRCGMRLKK